MSYHHQQQPSQRVLLTAQPQYSGAVGDENDADERSSLTDDPAETESSIQQALMRANDEVAARRTLIVGKTKFLSLFMIIGGAILFALGVTMLGLTLGTSVYDLTQTFLYAHVPTYVDASTYECGLGALIHPPQPRGGDPRFYQDFEDLAIPDPLNPLTACVWATGQNQTSEHLFMEWSNPILATAALMFSGLIIFGGGLAVMTRYVQFNLANGVGYVRYAVLAAVRGACVWLVLKEWGQTQIWTFIPLLVIASLITVLEWIDDTFNSVAGLRIWLDSSSQSKSKLASTSFKSHTALAPYVLSLLHIVVVMAGVLTPWIQMAVQHPSMKVSQWLSFAIFVVGLCGTTVMGFVTRFWMRNQLTRETIIVLICMFWMLAQTWTLWIGYYYEGNLFQANQNPH